MKMIVTLTRIPARAKIYLKLKFLRIFRRLHLQKKAESGRAKAFVAIDIEGSILARPKMKSMFVMKSQRAG